MKIYLYLYQTAFSTVPNNIEHAECWKLSQIPQTRIIRYDEKLLTITAINDTLYNIDQVANLVPLKILDFTEL